MYSHTSIGSAMSATSQLTDSPKHSGLMKRHIIITKSEVGSYSFSYESLAMQLSYKVPYAREKHKQACEIRTLGMHERSLGWKLGYTTKLQGMHVRSTSKRVRYAPSACIAINSTNRSNDTPGAP